MISTPIAHAHNHTSIGTQSTGPGVHQVWNLFLTALFALLLAGFSLSALAAGATLEDIEVGSLPGNKVQIVLKLSGKAPEPRSFTINNPARIALDLPGTTVKLSQRSRNVGVGSVKSITAVEAQGRTRVVLNLVDMVPYETRVEGNRIIVALEDTGVASARPSMPAPAPAGKRVSAAAPGEHAIRNIDFRRGENGEGRIIVELSDPSIPVDMRQEAGRVVVDFFDTRVPEKLQARLDVLDFATPVKLIDVEQKGDKTRMVITATGAYDHVAYQTNDIFTIEVKPTTKEEQEARKRKEVGYTGERLSLNFQDIEVRSVLQLIADFTGINIVVSDSVTGNLTLRLQNVPWDQALDIILKTKGLAMRQNENVMLVAPAEEIAAREKLELEAQKQIEELAPLFSDYIQINYAKAADIAALLKGSDTSLLSERGTVSIDERTNILLVQDTAEKLGEIRQLVSRLDIPVRQVLIESRIVIASNDFAKELGVKFGLSHQDIGRPSTIVGGGLPGDLANNNPVIENPAGSGNEALMVNLPANNAFGAANLLVGNIGEQLLRLELSAMQAEGRGEVISSPRVITSNQREAVIRQGVEIPYLQAASSGATAVQFKEAVLALRVTPQITPDDRIIMDLKVNKDSVGQIFSGVPSVDTRAVETQVLVDNGETVVLGGIYEQERARQADKIPFLGEIPGFGWMFKRTINKDEKTELLVFVSPKIVKESLVVE